MGLSHFILFCQLAALVNGDVLVDFAKKSLEELPDWIQDNVDDAFQFHYPYNSQRSASFMRLELTPSNFTANGMKTIRLSETPSVSGALFTGRLDINLTVIADLALSGSYEASGELFPYVDEIPFKSSGVWSASTTLIMTQPYHITMNVSMNGTMNLDSEYQTKYKQETSFSEFTFDNFLEDNLDQWYYPIMKEGFAKELEERAVLALSYDYIDVFKNFFEDKFKSIEYSDIVG